MVQVAVEDHRACALKFLDRLGTLVADMVRELNAEQC